MKHLLLLAASLLTLSVTSCGQRQIRGGGDEGTDKRTLTAFTAVKVQGSDDVEFLPADAPRVEISGYKNLFPHYKTTIKNGTLYLGFETDDDLDISIRNSNLRVRVYSPGFKSLGLAGSGNATIRPGAATPVQRIEIAGSGDVTVEQSDVPELAMNIAGSGNIKARRAKAATVRAEIAGSGDIETSAANRLDVKIAGSGNVNYWGSPQVSSNIAGSGDIVRR